MMPCADNNMEKSALVHQQILKCPRCDSSNTKFCYYNNYSLSQPRHFCKACKRYWTRGGTLRNVPVGGGCRKKKKIKKPLSTSTHVDLQNPNPNACPNLTKITHHLNLIPQNPNYPRFETRVFGFNDPVFYGYDLLLPHMNDYGLGFLCSASGAAQNNIDQIEDVGSSYPNSFSWNTVAGGGGEWLDPTNDIGYR